MEGAGEAPRDAISLTCWAPVLQDSIYSFHVAYGEQVPFAGRGRVSDGEPGGPRSATGRVAKAAADGAPRQ